MSAYTVEHYPIFISILALLFSAFFSGIETAFLAADKLGIELAKEQKGLTGRFLVSLLKRPDYFISTTLVGNTIALVTYSTAMTTLLDPFLRQYIPVATHGSILLLVLQTLISTSSILVFAEFIPKSIFLRSPNHMLSISVLPALVIAYLARPLVVATTAASKAFITYVLRQRYQNTRPVFELTDLHTFIKNSLNINRNLPADVSAKIVSRFIEFRQIKVRDCMTPRKEIVAVSITEGIPALQEAAVQSDYAKILIYKNDIDDIIGYCHAKALFKRPSSITSILKPILVVSETSLASEVMVQLTHKKRSLALVVDEFGGTSGIISIEDVIEEIVGNIREVPDMPSLVAQKLGKDTYLLSARHEIDDLNEKYALEIPQGEYDTLSGFITSTIARIPEVGEVVTIDAFVFTIVAIEDTHIDTVKLERNRKPAAS